MNKKHIICTLSMIFPLILGSCGKDTKRVSFFYYDSKDTFITSLANKIINKFGDEIEYENYFAENSQYTQNKQIIQEIEKNSDLYVINICDRLSASTLIEKISKVNKPIIFVNREPLIRDLVGKDNVYYVGTNPIFEGTEQATIVDSLFGGAKNYIDTNFDKNKDGIIQLYLMKGELGHQDTELRSKNCLSKLENLGYKIEIIQTKVCDWSKEKAKTEFEKSYRDLLYEDGSSKIELLISNNDEMALGVIDYLKELPDYDSSELIYNQFFPIVGVNGTKEGVKAVESGDMFGTVKNDYEIQADAIKKLSDRLLNNLPLDDFEYSFDNEKFIHINGESILNKRSS